MQPHALYNIIYLWNTLNSKRNSKKKLLVYALHMHKAQRGQKLSVVRQVLTTLNFVTTPSLFRDHAELWALKMRRLYPKKGKNTLKWPCVLPQKVSLDTVGSFAKVAYIRDWIQLDICINAAFPIGWFLSIT